jgi:signal transduction histidine kinase
MLFDDRLATVLRSGAAGEQAARTQFRQLLDLLGTVPPEAKGPLVQAAYHRLAEIAGQLPAADQSRILREPWLRLRNPRLLAHLAEGDPQAAAAAMATARLDQEQWLELIPRLPVTARGFLRHRRDLPEGARTLLARLGVGDLVLPQPEAPASAGRTDGEGISALVKRIEAFQQARKGSPAQLAPRLPLDDGAPRPLGGEGGSCDFSTDAAGRIDWAEAGFAPLLAGVDLAGGERLDAASLAAMRARRPLRGGSARLDGVAAIAGEWRIDAAPRFTSVGAFAGYCGRLRRPSASGAGKAAAGPAADRMGQVLHELRTPVGAVQGFAEIIQQQLFGAAPNAYRALAAAVAVDAARLLAGFDEIDRMVRLESGELDLSGEGSNLRTAIERTIKRLDGVTRPRSAQMRLLVSGESFAVGLGEDDGALLAWRVLATLAGALAPGEVIELSLRGDRAGIELRAELPIALASGDVFAGGPPAQAPAVTAGMFGAGFTLRLARAEAEAAGGSLLDEGEALVLALPGLTAGGGGHSEGIAEGGREAAGPAA